MYRAVSCILHHVVCDLVVGKMQRVSCGVEKCILQSSEWPESGAEPDIPSCRLCGFATPHVEGFGLLLSWAEEFLCVWVHRAWLCQQVTVCCGTGCPRSCVTVRVGQRWAACLCVSLLGSTRARSGRCPMVQLAVHYFSLALLSVTTGLLRVCVP